MQYIDRLYAFYLSTPLPRTWTAIVGDKKSSVWQAEQVLLSPCGGRSWLWQWMEVVAWLVMAACSVLRWLSSLLGNGQCDMGLRWRMACNIDIVGGLGLQQTAAGSVPQLGWAIRCWKMVQQTSLAPWHRSRGYVCGKLGAGVEYRGWDVKKDWQALQGCP